MTASAKVLWLRDEDDRALYEVKWRKRVVGKASRRRGSKVLTISWNDGNQPETREKWLTGWRLGRSKEFWEGSTIEGSPVRYTEIKSGVDHPDSKIDADLLEIIRFEKRMGMDQRTISRRYGINEVRVSRALRAARQKDVGSKVVGYSDHQGRFAKGKSWG